MNKNFEKVRLVLATIYMGCVLIAGIWAWNEHMTVLRHGHQAAIIVAEAEAERIRWELRKELAKPENQYVFVFERGDRDEYDGDSYKRIKIALDRVNKWTDLHILSVESIEYEEDYKGEERYVFIWADTQANTAEIMKQLAKFASNEELSFSWYDAAVISQKIRQRVNFKEQKT